MAMFELHTMIARLIIELLNEVAVNTQMLVRRPIHISNGDLTTDQFVDVFEIIWASR